MRPLILVNANISHPPVSPVGMEYVGHWLANAGIPVELIDLAFEPDWEGALRQVLSHTEPLAVGISVRNTDDCSFTTKQSFLPWISQLVREVKQLTDAPVVLGGVGFSIYPEPIVELTQADLGIDGDGEEATLHLIECLTRGREISELPNLVYRRDQRIVCNPRAEANLKTMPLPHRQLFDNPRYEREGAMVGVETKRGCSQQCIYCADPVAKGKRIRTRPPEMIADEMEGLLEQGVSWFHLCDSEFNLPLWHAKEVCRALLQRGLGDKLRWYCYCSPLPFDHELARLMRNSGCVGINFGVDSLCDDQLARLARSHRLSHIQELVHILKEEGLNFMFDLLIGCLGETEETVRTTIEQVKRLEPPWVGIAVGVRIYPHTPLWELTSNFSVQDLHPPQTPDFSEPAFYLSLSLGTDPLGLVRQLIGDDPRFMLLSVPAEVASYNYVDDQFLCQAIAQGARGAYWDILRNSKT